MSPSYIIALALEQCLLFFVRPFDVLLAITSMPQSTQIMVGFATLGLSLTLARNFRSFRLFFFGFLIIGNLWILLLPSFGPVPAALILAGIVIPLYWAKTR